MDYVRLGSAGLKVSRICLGMMSYGSQAERAWHLDETAAEPIVKAAIDAGITFFDTADTYSGGVTEQITGRLLGRLFDRREDYVLATKVYFPMGPGPNDRGLSRKHVLSAIDASLRRLGTEYVDLYQIHRWDYDTPIEETMEALHEVVRAGKARYIGASSMFAWQFAKAQHVAERNGWTRFAAMQNHYNLMYREEEREMLPLCADQGIAVLPYSPLARGMLAGNRTRQGERRTARAGDDPLSDERYNTDADFDVVDRLVAVAAERGAPPAQVALAWLLSRPGVTAPIIGATRLGHITDAVAASQLTLTQEEVRRLEEPYRPPPRPRTQLIRRVGAFLDRAARGCPASVASRGRGSGSLPRSGRSHHPSWSCGFPPRYRSTARTRRLSLSPGGRPSLAKMLATCFSTAPPETTSSAAIPAFDRPSAISAST